MAVYGGVEAGGTKFVCVVGSGPADVRERARIPTGGPGETMAAVVEFLRGAAERHGGLDAIGVGAFGPLELRPGHPDRGRVLQTPKPGWEGTDLVGPLSRAFGVPVEVDTDVNAAALAEWRWGAGVGTDTLVYVTVGTGIGGGAVVGGRTLSALAHPEMGHVAVPRAPGDPFPGICPFHGGCWEGMASGPAIARRWGAAAEDLGERRDDAVAVEAAYLAAGLRQVVYVLAPDRIVMGGGVMSLPGLLEATRVRLAEELAGYGVKPEHLSDQFLVAPSGPDSGPLGALALAELTHGNAAPGPGGNAG